MKSKVRISKETYVWKNEDGKEVIYYKDGKKHRADGSAVKRFNADKQWYSNGVLHREDNPAVECFNGDRELWLNGVRHREDGPAIEYSGNGIKWILNDIKYTKQKFNHYLDKKNLNGKFQSIIESRHKDK